jgi:hypothetical protein
MSSRNASRQLVALALRAAPRGGAAAGAPALRGFSSALTASPAACAGLAGAPRAGGLLPDAARALAAVSAVRRRWSQRAPRVRVARAVLFCACVCSQLPPALTHALRRRCPAARPPARSAALASTPRPRRRRRA